MENLKERKKTGIPYYKVKLCKEFRKSKTCKNGEECFKYHNR